MIIQRHIEYRNKVNEVQKQLEVSAVKRILASWNAATQEAVRLQTCTTNAEIANTNRKLRNALQLWCMNAKAMHNNRLQNEKALQHQRYKQLKELFTIWNKYWTIRKRARSACQLLLDLTVNNHKRNALTIWNQHMKDLRYEEQQLQKADDHYKHKQLGNMLNKWKQKYHEEKRIQVSTKQTVVVSTDYRIRRALHKWLHYSKRETNLYTNEHKLQHYIYQRQLHTVFSHWLGLAKYLRQKALSEEYARQKLKGRIFQGWKLLLQRGQLARQVQAQVNHNLLKDTMKRWKKAYLYSLSNRLYTLRVERSLRHAVSTWKAMAHTQRTVKALYAGNQRNRLREMYQRWFSYTQDRLRKKAKEREAIQTVQRGIQNRVMQAWHSWAIASKEYRRNLKTEQELRTSIERRLEVTRLASLRILFTTWKLRVQMTRKCRNLANRFTMHGTATRCFQAWATYVKEKKQAEIAAEAIISRYRERLMRQAFHGLREAVLITKAESHLYRSLLQRTFRGWSMATQTSRITFEEAAKVALAHHERSIHRRFFLRWHQYSSRRRLIHKLQTTLIERRKQRQIHKVMIDWITWCRLQQHNRLVYERALRFFNRHMLSITFTAWKGLCFRKRQKQQQQQQQLLLLNNNTVNKIEERNEQLNENIVSSATFLKATGILTSTSSSSSSSMNPLPPTGRNPNNNNIVNNPRSRRSSVSSLTSSTTTTPSIANLGNNEPIKYNNPSPQSQLPDVDTATPRTVIKSASSDGTTTTTNNNVSRSRSNSGTGRRLSVSDALSQRILDTFNVKGKTNL